MRHMPVVLTMRELIEAGAIGEVKAIWCRHFVGHGGDFYFKDWHADRRRTTSLLLQKGAHDIDVMHWLAGGYTTPGERARRPRPCTAGSRIAQDRSGQRFADFVSDDNWPPLAQKGLAPVMDVEDLSMANLQLDNGVFLSYQQCHFTPDYWRNYTVIGTQGRLENFGDTSGGVVKVWNSEPLGLPRGCRPGGRDPSRPRAVTAARTRAGGGVRPLRPRRRPHPHLPDRRARSGRRRVRGHDVAALQRHADRHPRSSTRR